MALPPWVTTGRMVQGDSANAAAWTWGNDRYGSVTLRGRGHAVGFDVLEAGDRIRVHMNFMTSGEGCVPAYLFSTGKDGHLLLVGDPHYRYMPVSFVSPYIVVCERVDKAREVDGEGEDGDDP